MKPASDPDVLAGLTEGLKKAAGYARKGHLDAAVERGSALGTPILKCQLNTSPSDMQNGANSAETGTTIDFFRAELCNAGVTVPGPRLCTCAARGDAGETRRLAVSFSNCKAETCFSLFFGSCCSLICRLPSPSAIQV
jgi:hypothetical protein